MLTALTVLAVVLSILALLLAVGAVIRLQRQRGSPMEAYKGLPDGSPVGASVIAQFLDGEQVDAWLDGPTLLSIVSESCPACEEFIVELNNLLPSGVRVLVISEGNISKLRALASFQAR